MAANVNTLKATLERYRKEIDALRGQLKTGQQYLKEQRKRAIGWEDLHRQERQSHRKTYQELSELRERVDTARFNLRLRYLFTGRI